MPENVRATVRDRSNTTQRQPTRRRETPRQIGDLPRGSRGSAVLRIRGRGFDSFRAHHFYLLGARDSRAAGSTVPETVPVSFGRPLNVNRARDLVPVEHAARPVAADRRPAARSGIGATCSSPDSYRSSWSGRTNNIPRALPSPVTMSVTTPLSRSSVPTNPSVSEAE